LSTYGPHTEVLVDVQGQVLKLPAPELMPNPWMFPNENDWVLEDPRIEEEK
jgi:hypothetical protein